MKNKVTVNDESGNDAKEVAVNPVPLAEPQSPAPDAAKDSAPDAAKDSAADAAKDSAADNGPATPPPAGPEKKLYVATIGDIYNPYQNLHFRTHSEPVAAELDSWIESQLRADPPLLREVTPE